MQAIYTKVIAWLNALTPSNCPVIVADQNAPAPARPFATVKIASVVDVARDFSANVRDLTDPGTGPFPYALVSQAEDEEGGDPEAEPVPPIPPYVPNFVRDTVRFVRLTANVQVYGLPGSIYSAEAIAQGILDHAYNSDAALDFLGRSLVFQLVLSPPQSLSALIGSEMEPRVVMALQFGATRDLIYQVGGISTVIITGSAGAQNFESEATWPSQ
jgi:hypothetical protein